jgi:hypothetical protein
MEIIVEFHKGEDGRAAGTVRPVGEAKGRSFSGNLEFLALVEDLCQAESDLTPSFTDYEATCLENNIERKE